MDCEGENSTVGADDIRAARTLFRCGDLSIALAAEELVFVCKDEAYTLGCIPNEPCTLLIKGDNVFAIVHNAFAAEEIRAAAEIGESVSAVTGSLYDAKRICETLAFAAENRFDGDLGYIEGKLAVERLKSLGAFDEASAVSPAELGVRTIGSEFSHSKKLDERVMYTAEGKAYVRIKK